MADHEQFIKNVQAFIERVNASFPVVVCERPECPNTRFYGPNAHRWYDSHARGH